MKTVTLITDEMLNNIVQALLRVDRKIAAVILFGSAVCSPDLALDIDLLVISAEPKGWDDYWKAAVVFSNLARPRGAIYRCLGNRQPNEPAR